MRHDGTPCGAAADSVRALAELNAAKAEAAHAEAARLVSPAKRDAARRCNLYGYQVCVGAAPYAPPA
jgi:hypothetical protein